MENILLLRLCRCVIENSSLDICIFLSRSYLLHKESSTLLIRSFLVLLFAQFGNKAVAHVACDVFQLLISHWQHLQRLESTLPKKIIEVR